MHLSISRVPRNTSRLAHLSHILLNALACSILGGGISNTRLAGGAKHRWAIGPGVCCADTIFHNTRTGVRLVAVTACCRMVLKRAEGHVGHCVCGGICGGSVLP